MTGPRDERGTPVAEPAGGTTTRSSAGRAGRSVLETTEAGAMTDPNQTALPKAYRSTDVEGAGLRALAGRGRLRPRRCRLDGRPGPPAVHDHPATAQRHGFPPPRACPADRGRGPPGPPRSHARPSDAVPARARPCQHRRPVRARRDHREGGRDPPVARPRALSRADARVLRDDPAGDARPATARRGVGRLGPAAVHDGRGLGHGRPRRVRAAVPRRAGIPDRGARQLVPGLPDQRQRPGGRADARDRDAVVRPLSPHRRGDRPARPRRRRSRWPRRGRRRSSATWRWRSIPRTRATRPSSGGWRASRSSSGTCRSSRTRWSIGRSAPVP